MVPPSRKGTSSSPPQSVQWTDYQGQSVDLRDYEGKVVLINFWATWCGPCRYEIPALVEMSNEYDPEQVAIIGISLDQGPTERVLPLIGEFVERLAINYPVVHDSQQELLRAFYKKNLARVGVPLTVVFDRAGRVYKTHVGVPRDRSGRLNPPRSIRRGYRDPVGPLVGRRHIAKEGMVRSGTIPSLHVGDCALP